MKISVIYAQHAATGTIGHQGPEAMLWNIPEDFKYFKEKTMGKPMLMGYSTFESLPRLLPGRFHYVMTKRKGLHRLGKLDSVQFIGSVSELIKDLTEEGCEELMVIGGGDIIKMMYPFADTVYRSRVDVQISLERRLPLVMVPDPIDLKRIHRFEMTSQVKCETRDDLVFEVYNRMPE